MDRIALDADVAVGDVGSLVQGHKRLRDTFDELTL